MQIPLIETPNIRIPRLGLGTWPMKGAECTAAVESALAMGYRHIDTAQMYGNEVEVGVGLKNSGLPRADIFLTTKVWNDSTNGDQIRAAFDACMARLATPYVDLLLIHWPSPQLDLDSAMKALAAIRAEGRAKAVGVSNFPPKLLQRAIDSGIGLACLQVEHHAFLDQSKLLGICRANGMALTSYSPLGKGNAPGDATLQAIGRKHGASPAQVALAWLLAMPDVVLIPKAASAARQAENMDALKLTLDAEDLAAIAALPKDKRFVNPGMAPDWVNG